MAEKENARRQPSEKLDEGDEVPGRYQKALCQPCTKNGNKTEAGVFCSSCREFLCTGCLKVYDSFSFTKNHKVVDADVSGEEPVVYDMLGLDRCDKHNKKIKFFCADDGKLCCSTCTIIQHNKCNHVEEIGDMKISDKNNETVLKIEISKVNENSKFAAKHVTNGAKRMNELFENLFECLTSIRTSVNAKLDNLETEIRREAMSFSERKTTEYGDKRTNCEETVKLLEHNLEMLDEIKRRGTPEQQFIMRQRMQESLASANKTVSEDTLNLENLEICLELSEPFEKFLSTAEKLGSLKTNISKVTIDSLIEGKPVKLEIIKSVDLKQSEDDTKEPFYTGMAFLPDGRLIVVDNKNSKCLIYSEQLEQLGSYKFSVNHFSLVKVSDNEVAVTLAGQKIDVLRVSGSIEITYVRTITTNSKYFSICMKDDYHFVAGTYDEDKPVRIVSLSGEEEDFNINFPDKKYTLDDRRCTYIKNSDKLILTDRYEHTVYIYYIKDRSRVVVKDESISEPRGVAVGPFDSIFVCSRPTGSVVQVSQTGQILSTHTLDMKYPVSVCISDDKTRLAVSNNDIGKHKLKLFNVII